MFNNSSSYEKNAGSKFDGREYTEAKKTKKENDVQKDSTLQPITKVNTKLDKELQEWEVESTKGGANDGGG